MKRRGKLNASRTACAAICLAGSVAFVQPSQAAEYGWGTYLLGLSIPMIGFTPPPGFYFSDSIYAYQGSASASGKVKFPFGHVNLAGQIKEDFLVNISTLSWVTDYKILGGSLGFAATIPFPIGTERTSAGAALTGPLGNTFSGSLTESAGGIGDMAVASFLGWQDGNHHWNLAVTGTIPTGVYDPDRIAFLGLHRPSVDVRGAYTYLDPKTGLEISTALGMTFNFINSETNYQTGDELHFEWDVNEHFASGWSLGVGGYVYDQVTGDSGSGNRIGPFEGRVVAVGPLVGYTFKVMNIIPVNLNARWFHEFDVRNRVTGNSIFGSISLPLVGLPPAVTAKD
jgi:hypothetical protein